MSTRDRQTNLTPEKRQALIRKVFEAITTVAFLKFKNELARDSLAEGEKAELHRSDYFEEFRKLFWADFQDMAAHCRDDRVLYDMLEDFQRRGQVVSLHDLRREIIHDAALRRHLEIHGEPLSEPAPQRKRNRDIDLDR